MSAWLIAMIGVVYAVVAFDLIRSGNVGLGIAFVGYSIDDVNQKPVTVSELRKMTKEFIIEEEANMGDFSDEFECPL